MQNEIWRPVPEYESFYQVSNLGRVKRLHKKGTEKILNCVLKKDGYLYADLCSDTTRKKFGVHRLVALAFIPNINNEMFVDHIDMNKVNNNVNNLRWVDRSLNNMNKKAYGQSGKKYISYYEKRNKYSVEIKRYNIKKQFSSLLEALVFRNNKINELNINFNINYDN
jgi:hypothetical protein